MKIELDVRGIIVNLKKVYGLMRDCGLSGKHHRKKQKVQQDLIKDNILIQKFLWGYEK